MDLMSQFRMDTLQPLVTLIIPGTTAVAPYALIGVIGNDKIATFLDKHEFTFGTVVVFIAIAAGLVLEDFGSLIEAHIWDKCHRDAARDENIWWKYLRTAFAVEPVGQRYLRTILLRMKFELSFGLSLILFVIGLVILNGKIALLSSVLMTVLGSLLFLLAAYLLWESYQSSCLLKKLHAVLTEEIFVVGKNRVESNE